ncbi:MAG: hypothetical protein PHI79_04675 [Sulfurovaceae bacterium]|nr:hypothetical protein [Sulfurovaceae bacterium]MDD5548879.1 hypothetical protein [Sulfurovaceae bacterium]
MNTIDKELESRRGEIRFGLEVLYNLNMRISGWDIPELDDNEASKKLFAMIEEELAKLKKEIKKQ